MPIIRQKRSKLAPTACQAPSTNAVASGTGGVIILFMALPFFRDSAPRAYRLKAGNADPPISTFSGTSPEKMASDPIEDRREISVQYNFRQFRFLLSSGANRCRIGAPLPRSRSVTFELRQFPSHRELPDMTS